MQLNHRVVLGLLAAASLAACSSVPLDKAPVETRSGDKVVSGTTGSGNATSSQTQVASVSANNLDSASMGNVPRVVYFDYDSYVVRDDGKPTIEANAKALEANRSRHVVVEGHTDDRGGSEYNLALGQKRADAVMKSLELLGVQPKQVEAVSFGKERPAVQGENEDAWAKNRRAELAAR